MKCLNIYIVVIGKTWTFFLGKTWKWKLDRIKMMRSKKNMNKTRRRHIKKIVDLITTT